MEGSKTPQYPTPTPCPLSQGNTTQQHTPPPSVVCQVEAERHDDWLHDKPRQEVKQHTQCDADRQRRQRLARERQQQQRADKASDDGEVGRKHCRVVRR